MTSRTRRRRGPVETVRKQIRVGPYFRRLSLTADRRGVRAGWTSQGFRWRWGKAGPCTVNTTTGRISWDHPGPGAHSRDIPDWVMRRLPRWLTRQPDGTDFYS